MFGNPIKVLHIDHGEEYSLHEFANFCENLKIKRQLAVAYTPHQNGVHKRKNYIVLKKFLA